MRRLRSALPLLVIFFAFGVAVHAETYYAYLSSAQEVPTNNSTGTGFARVVINPTNLTLSYSVTFTGLTSNQTASHIHSGAGAGIGVNGPVTINFGAVGGTSGTITGTGTLTAQNLADIRAHLAYVNVHTANFGGGEIRGQLGPHRPVDVDGDGRTDFSVLRFPGNTPPAVSPISFWNRNSFTGNTTVTQWGDSNVDFPTPGDYDGDGKDDLAVYRDAATTGGQSNFYILRSSDSAVQVVNFGTRGDQEIPRDYDGDGITDPAIYRNGASNGSPAFWWIRQSSTNSNLVVQFGLTGDGQNSGDVPVPGDYDGDGKVDIALYRVGQSPANTFIVRRSSDGGVRFQQWGDFTTDYIAPGDYDGDGKTDFAAVRTGAAASSPMVWYILQSSNNQPRVQQFGISSDFVVQGDYDGDARTDMAIYRGGATTGSPNFYWILNSLTNTTQVSQWGLRGDFPANSFDAR